MKSKFQKLRDESFAFITSIIHTSERLNDEFLKIPILKDIYACKISEAADLVVVRFLFLNFIKPEDTPNIPRRLFDEGNKQVPCLFFYIENTGHVSASFTTIATTDEFVTKDLLLNALSILESGVKSFVENAEKLIMMDLLKDALKTD